MITVLVPMRTVRGNPREHHMARHRRVKAERQNVAWAFVAAGLNVKPRPKPPLAVVLTRIAPSTGLDPGDNLATSMKAVRDQVAEWLGVDDKREDLVAYRYAQERGPWGVRIEIA